MQTRSNKFIFVYTPDPGFAREGIRKKPETET
jgi:hypothetical protein